MKYLISLLVSASVTFLTVQSLANEGAEKEHGATAGHRDNNSLFPKKTPNLEKGEPPAMTELVDPAPMASVKGDSVTLKWKEVAGAEAYHVQVAKDPNFKWLVADEHFVKGTSFDVKGLEANHHYSWRVAGWKDGQHSGASKAYFVKSVFQTH